MKPWPGRILAIVVGLLMVIVLCFWAGTGRCSLIGPGWLTAYAQEAEPTPTVDPLDIPELPENPTQMDIGRHAYYYNCMPCHGDRGQGLTDEWRAVWVDDHQNCWARGCHAGHIEDGGFPIPTVVPAVIGTEYSLRGFSSADALHDYLVDTHPPQRPGALSEEEYWALTAFLLAENQRLLPGTKVGPAATGADTPTPSVALVDGKVADEESATNSSEGFNFALAGSMFASLILAGITVILIWRGRKPTDR